MLCTEHIRLTLGHLMTRNNQQPTCTNAVCEPDTNDQTLSQGVSEMEERQEKNNFQSDIKLLLGKDCEAEKI